MGEGWVGKSLSTFGTVGGTWGWGGCGMEACCSCFIIHWHRCDLHPAVAC